MSRWLKLMLVFLLVFASLPVIPAQAQTLPTCDYFGTHSNGATYCIKMPPPGYWNGGLVVFAHGYVPVTAPVDIPWSQMMLADSTTLPDLVNGMGYAFATTSYSANGLAVVRGGIDILDLMEVFKTNVGEPNKAYLVGASEGGLITTLMIENHPGVFDGGMALCGPIGNFKEQINYWGNFRVAFDAYYPDVLPPSAVNIPQEVIDDWDTVYAPGIGYALATADPAQLQALLAVTGAPIDPTDPVNSIPATVLGLLWYNVFATNNGIEILGGQPFDNTNYQYLDPYLNLVAPRFSADKKALNTMDKKYETSGELKRPLVTMHTTGDPIVPSWHETLYDQKVLASGKGALHQDISVARYGHCNFTTAEMLGGFTWLASQPAK